MKRGPRSAVIPNRLRAAREAKGQTLRHVAAVTGIDKQNLSMAERCLRNLNDEDKLTLSRYYRRSITSLFFVEEPAGGPA